MVGFDSSADSERGPGASEFNDLPYALHAGQDTEESAKRWHLMHVVRGMGTEIDEARFDALAAEYEASRR